jgi:hypothetical protein
MRENLEDQGLDGKLILKYIYRRNNFQRSIMDWCVSQSRLVYRSDFIGVTLRLDWCIAQIGFVCLSDWIGVSLRFD